MGTYDKCDKIGSGTYGVVYRAQSPRGSNFALKCNQKNKSCSFFGSASELDINHKLGVHPYIVSLNTITQGVNPFKNGPMSPVMSTGSTMDKLHFVFPLGLCDLRSYVRLNLSTLELRDLKTMMVEILLGMEYIHGRGYIHRDIKPDNVIVMKDKDTGTVTMNIGDFGLSKMHVSNIPNTPGIMTSYYRAPEVLLCSNKLRYGMISDMWSVGCTFFEIVSGKPLTGKVKDDNRIIANAIINVLPYTLDTTKLSVMDVNNIVKKDLQPKPDITPGQFLRVNAEGIKKFNEIGGIDSFYRVLMGMLAFDPDQRWSATKVLNDPFFQEYRDKIQEVRTSHPPLPRSWPEYKIREDLVERTWMLSTAMGVYNKRRSYHWYTDRILFHSVCMMDRVISYLGDKEDKSIRVTDYRGTLLTKHITELYYISCLYLCIKYFSSIHVVIPFEAMASREYTTAGNILKVENFERVLIGEILNYEIYLPTPYDEMMNLSDCSEMEVFSMFILLINGHHKNKTPSQATQMWLSNKDYYMTSAEANYKQ